MILLLPFASPGSAVPGIFGQDENTVVVINHTGLKIVRITVGNRTYEDVSGTSKGDKILLNVTPGRHHLGLIFRGGAHFEWRNFNFTHVHQITFSLEGNRVSAHPQN